MKVTKDKGTTVVEISECELMKYELTFEKLDCGSTHTRNVIEELLSKAMGKDFLLRKEIHILPGSSDGCVIVCKKRETPTTEAVSLSVHYWETSEIFSCLFS